MTLNSGELVHVKAGHYYQLCNDTEETAVLYQVATVPAKKSPVGRRSFRRGGDMLERYPSVRFAFLEAGCAWAPYWIERLYEHIARDPHDVPASEYVRQGRIVFSCEPDEAALPRVIDALGDECIMYASDYPHGDSKWPNTVSALRSIGGLREGSLERIFAKNAERFYGRLSAPA